MTVPLAGRCTRKLHGAPLRAGAGGGRRLGGAYVEKDGRGRDRLSGLPMRAVVQRVQRGAVRVDGAVVGEIGAGLLVLLGTMRDDTPVDTAWMVKKLLGLRIFADAEGKMNRSVVDTGGAVLLVSQFTVCADVGKGNRPSFMPAMAPEHAVVFVEQVRAGLAEVVPVSTGSFGAHMEVELVNDGPVTLWLDSRGSGS